MRRLLLDAESVISRERQPSGVRCWCVAATTVTPARAKALRRLMSVWAFVLSRCVAGSSARMSTGRLTTARARQAIWRWPAERLEGRRSARSAAPHLLRARSALRRASCAVSSAASAGNMTFSRTVLSSSRSSSCIMRPMERLSHRRWASSNSSMRSPATTTSPFVGSMRPAKSLRMVLLPHPVLP